MARPQKDQLPSVVSVTSFFKQEDGTYSHSTRTYRRKVVEGKQADSSGPEGFEIELERIVIHGRYIPVNRRDKHSAVHYDQHSFKPIYLKRVK